MRDIRLCMRDDALRVLKLSRKYELGVEIQYFKDPKFNYEEFKYKKLCENVGNRSLHAPFGDLSFGSVDPLLREVFLKRVTNAYRQAEKYGFTDVIIHHGYVPNTSPPNKWLKRSIKFWNQNIGRFQKAPRICIENMLDRDYGILRELIDSIDNKKMRICLDIGHAHCFSEKNVLEWIKGLNQRIGYVHMHNNYGIYDEHNAISNGNIQYVKVLEYLNMYAPNSILAIETRGVELEASIIFLREWGML